MSSTGVRNETRVSGYNGVAFCRLGGGLDCGRLNLARRTLLLV